MVIPLVNSEDVLVKNPSHDPNIKIKGRIEDSKYKTYPINHDLKDSNNGLKNEKINLDKFFWDYNEVLNLVIKDIWNTIVWKEWEIKRKNDPKYKQKRLYPNYRKDRNFKTELRYKYLENWKYSAHWINSVVDTAYSILDSWKKNYNKGKRKRNYPIAKRLFVRIKQTLMKIEGNKLRISIRPRQFIYIDLTKRYFKINGRIGEPILTPTSIHLPIEQSNNSNDPNKIKVEDEKVPVQKIGWDLNKFSMDGFSPELGWIRISLKDLHTAHITYDNKRRRINKLGSTKKIVGKRLKAKYSKKERNRCGQIAHEITNVVKKIGNKHGFEGLNKYGMFKRNKKWNRELGYTNWKQITDQMEYKSSIELVDPYHTSKECSRCGCVNKDLKGEKFECVNKNCGLVINRQSNAAINVYLRMEGLSQNIGWFDENVLSEFTQTGAERKETNELVRSLYDLMKPQFYGVRLMCPTKVGELKGT